MNASTVKALKRLQQASNDFDSPVPQRQETSVDSDSPVPLSPNALPDGVNPFKIDGRAGLSFGMFECTGCGYQTEDTVVDMAQHFWTEHPEWTFGGKRIRHLQTGNEYYTDPPEDMQGASEAAEVLRRWLGDDIRLFDEVKFSACWDAICKDAIENGTPD